MAGGKGGWWGGGRHIRDCGSQTWPSRASRRMHSCVGTRSLTPELASREVVSGGSVVPGEEEDHLRPPAPRAVFPTLPASIRDDVEKEGRRLPWGPLAPSCLETGLVPLSSPTALHLD